MSALTISRGRSSPSVGLGRVLLYLVIVFFALMFMLPFVFALLSSLKTVQELRVFPPPVFPAIPQWANYSALFELPNLPFGIWYRNSMIITALTTAGTVLSASASAYGFSRFRWPGRDIGFSILLATRIFPEQLVLIPRSL